MISRELPQSALFQRLNDSDLVVMVNDSLYETTLHPNDSYLSFFGSKIALNNVVSLGTLQDISIENQYQHLKNSMIKKLENHQIGIPKDKISELSPKNFELSLLLVKIYFAFNKMKFHETERDSDTLSIDEIKLRYHNSPNFTQWLKSEFPNGFIAYKNSLFELNEQKSNFFIEVEKKRYAISKKPKINAKELTLGYVKSQTTFFESLFKHFRDKVQELEKNLEVNDDVKSFVQDVNNGYAILKQGEIFYKKLDDGKDVIYRHINGPYILYERRNKKYYKFPECDAGIELIKTGDGIEVNGRYPYFIGNYLHPASPKTKEELVPICCGDNDSITLSLDDNGSPLSKIFTVLNGIEFSVKNAYVSEDSAWSPMWNNEKEYKRFEIDPSNPSFDKNIVTNEVK
jgi:sporulation protein YlmC with PRC-barrel domain